MYEELRLVGRLGAYRIMAPNRSGPAHYSCNDHCKGIRSIKQKSITTWMFTRWTRMKSVSLPGRGREERDAPEFAVALENADDHDRPRIPRLHTYAVLFWPFTRHCMSKPLILLGT